MADLERIINKHSIDAELGIHDFILANMIAKNIVELSFALKWERSTQSSEEPLPQKQISPNRFDL